MRGKKENLIKDAESIISKRNGTVASGVVFDPKKELERSLIDPTQDVPEPPVILEINGTPVLTTKNISTTIGKAKSRKTFFVVGTLSAIASGTWGPMKGKRTDRTVLWIDTEMSQYHATMMVKRCVRLTEGKGNIIAYGLRPYTPAQRMAMIEHAIYNTPDLGFVAIDGLRDLLTRGINDEEEATTVTSLLMKWTSEQDIHINLILHQNKGDLNARGHIGTECINKSETVISVTKSKEAPSVSEVSAEYSRNIDFDPFAFIIDDTGLPVITDVPILKQEKRKTEVSDIRDDKHNEVLREVFRQRLEYRYSDLWRTVKVVFGDKKIKISDNSAKDFLKYYQYKKFVKNENSIWTYTKPVF